jgi:uncharacterized protein YutE (UPF0331/DUF86 family)
MVTDVRLNKVAIIERCLARIGQEYRGHEGELETNFTRQDSIILNLQRACEAAIDLAMHMVREGKLGIPQESREAFSLLAEAGRIPRDLCRQMQAMVGFRNVAVHDYRKLNLEIVRAIVEEHLEDFRAFGRLVLATNHAL